jgi:glycosyltransferase involved in cell wall biosynthesis
MRLAASLGVPFVFDAHEIYVEQLGLEPAFKTYYSNLEPTVLQYSAFWMIPNELAGRWMVEEYKKKGITVPEPLVSQNSFDYWKNPGRSNAIREALGLDATVKIALYQGGVTPLRNLDVIVKAASFLKDPWRIVFLGNGSEVEALHQLAGKLLNKRVFFLPAVSQDELLRYTASADVGLIPYGGVDVNTLFASPNKLYEYLQAALPILANRLPFLALKLEQTGSGILTDFSDPKAVAAALHDLDDKTLAKLRRKARKAKEVECWEEEAKPYVHRYLELGWKAGNPNKRVLV